MTKLSCGKETTSGRLLGCVIFFPQLTYVVNWGFRGGVEPPLHCTDCTAGGGHRGGGSPPCPGGLRGAGSPPLRDPGQHPRKFFFWTLY